MRAVLITAIAVMGSLCALFVLASGRVVYGDFKDGDAKEKAKALASERESDLSLLDKPTNALVTKLLYTFPDCTRKTLESFRKKKLEAWQKNCESSRSWLSLNMNTEAMAAVRNNGAST